MDNKECSGFSGFDCRGRGMRGSVVFGGSMGGKCGGAGGGGMMSFSGLGVGCVGY